MIHWPFPSPHRRRHIIQLATPIVLGMLSINIMDIVDTAMIARLGNAALAGTGFANFLFFVSFSVTVGISAGVQTLTARYLGNGQRHRCAEPLNAGLVIIGGYGLVFWALLAWLGGV